MDQVAVILEWQRLVHEDFQKLDGRSSSAIVDVLPGWASAVAGLALQAC